MPSCVMCCQSTCFRILHCQCHRTKALVLELLAAVCLVRGGHDIILSAFDNFKEVKCVFVLVTLAYRNPLTFHSFSHVISPKFPYLMTHQSPHTHSVHGDLLAHVEELSINARPVQVWKFQCVVGKRSPTYNHVACMLCYKNWYLFVRWARKRTALKSWWSTSSMTTATLTSWWVRKRISSSE